MKKKSAPLNEDERFDVVSRFFSAAVDREEAGKKLTDTEAVVMATWHAYGALDNGGFYYLFAHEGLDLEFLIRASRKVKMDRAAEIIDQAVALLPNRTVPQTDETAKAAVDKIAKKLETLSEKFWDTSTLLPDKLYDFIAAETEAIK